MIASAFALPVTVVLAFVLTAGHGSNGTKPTPTASGPLPAVTIAAPPTPSAATSAACVKVFAKLPVQLGNLDPRKTDTNSSFVAAWGNPAIVLRCGVAKPAGLNDPNAPQLQDVNGVIWAPDLQKNQAVFTTVDRAAYIEVTVPAGSDNPLTLLTAPVKALPQVCTAADAAGNTTNAKLPPCH